MGPSLGAINRSILLSCDYFVTPMSSDIFSILAIENIGKTIKNWRDTFKEGFNRCTDTELKIFLNQFHIYNFWVMLHSNIPVKQWTELEDLYRLMKEFYQKFL